jgi:cell division protein FtsB
MPRQIDFKPGKKLRRRIVVGAVSLAFIWIAFFDSHSLQNRIGWWKERNELIDENEALRSRIEAIEASLEQGLSDHDVERIAREQYGMRRPGETVYPQRHEP